MCGKRHTAHHALFRNSMLCISPGPQTSFSGRKTRTLQRLPGIIIG